MQKTAYVIRISDWSSDVCSSALFSLFAFLHVCFSCLLFLFARLVCSSCVFFLFALLVCCSCFVTLLVLSLLHFVVFVAMLPARLILCVWVKTAQEAIRKNFILISELLDEMLDFGYPQTTSTELWKQHIHTKAVRGKRQKT